MYKGKGKHILNVSTTCIHIYIVHGISNAIKILIN